MSFYKDSNECRLFKGNYEAAQAYGPGGTYAVKFENIVNPGFSLYSTTWATLETLGDGTYKITRTAAAEASYHYGIICYKNVSDVIKLNHKYYFQVDFYVSKLPTTSANYSFGVEPYYNGFLFAMESPTVAGEWETYHNFCTKSSIDTSQLRNRMIIGYLMSDAQGFSNGDYYMVRRPIFIDLTQSFGAGNEPTTQEELYEALPQLANGGYMTPVATNTLAQTYIPTTHKTSYWIGEDCDVHFNQQTQQRSSWTAYGVTLTSNSDGSVNVHGTVTEELPYNQFQIGNGPVIKRDGRKYLYRFNKSVTITNPQSTYSGYYKPAGYSPQATGSFIFSNNDGGTFSCDPDIYICLGDTIDVDNLFVETFDLTTMFGEGNEPTIEEFNRMYTDTYYPYTTETVIPGVNNWNTAYKNRTGSNKPIYQGYLNQIRQSNTVAYDRTVWGVTVSCPKGSSVYTASGTYTAGTGDPNYYFSQLDSLIENHKYYIRMNGGKYVSIYCYTGWVSRAVGPAYGVIVTASSTQTIQHTITIRFSDYTPEGTVIDEAFYPEIFDLTALFGAGNEPTDARICNELFGSNHVEYQTNTVIDSPLNLQAVIQEQVTKKLAGYDTNTIPITSTTTISGTYNDPLVCQYVPTETTQATSTGANLVDLGRYCKYTANSIDFKHLPDGKFKWIANHNTSENNLGRFTDIFTDKDGNWITATTGQVLRSTCYFDDRQGTKVASIGIACYNTEGNVESYLHIINTTDTPGQILTHELTLTHDVASMKAFMDWNVENGDYVIFHDFMFEIDTNVGTYEPYNHAQAGPSPDNPLPVIYNQCQEITINPGVTPTITSLEDTPKLIWAPTNYETDFTYNIFNENTRMRKYAGTDYVKFIPLGGVGTDTAWGMQVNNISLTAGKMYAFVFKYKRYNCLIHKLQQAQPTNNDSNAYGYQCVIKDSVGNYYSGTEELEEPSLTHLDNPTLEFQTDYDEGWSWYRFTAPTADTYMIGIGADSPNTTYVDSSKESYLQITNVGIYEGTFSNPTGNVTNHRFILNNGLERKLVNNLEMNKYYYWNDVVDTYSPYMIEDDTLCSVQIGRNVIYKLTGSENWKLASGKVHTFGYSLPKILNGGVCTHFQRIPESSLETVDGIFLGYTSTIFITKLDCDTVDEFKLWLAGQRSTNPVIVVASLIRDVDYDITYDNPLKVNLLPYQSIISHNGSSLTVNAKQYRDTKLPEGYTRCKYLQSNGTQYIDTGYCPSYKTGIVVDAQFLSYTRQDRLFGVTVGSTTSGAFSFDIYISSDWNFSYSRKDDFGNWNSITSANYDRHIFKNTPSIAAVDDTSVTTPTCTNTSSVPMYLFWSNLVGSGTVGKGTLKMYSCKLYEEDTLIRNYIPCLDTTNTPCMYDTITSTSYYNLGTGDFTYEIL